MSAGGIQAALDARLDASQSATIEVAWEGTAYTPSEGAPFLATRMAGLTRTPTGKGGDCAFEWSGRYQISAYFPVGQGKQPLLDKIDELIALFPRGLTLTCADGLQVKVLVATPQPAFQEGNWIHAPLIVEWFAHEIP